MLDIPSQHVQTTTENSCKKVKTGYPVINLDCEVLLEPPESQFVDSNVNFRNIVDSESIIGKVLLKMRCDGFKAGRLDNLKWKFQSDKQSGLHVLKILCITALSISSASKDFILVSIPGESKFMESLLIAQPRINVSMNSDGDQLEVVISIGIDKSVKISTHHKSLFQRLAAIKLSGESSKVLSQVIIPVYNAPSIFPTPKLAVTLFPYQLETISWMLSREENPISINGFVRSFGERSVDIITGNEVINEINPVKITGGILCDEMGMGKTLMVIALILLHSKFPMINYPNNLEKSKGTLIITPSTLTSQWLNEIERNAPQLNHYFYQGQDIEPFELAKYDVVLTTYQVLQKEFWFVPNQFDRSLRNPPKYLKRKSALVSLLWWRVVLDEAQQVESVVSQTASIFI